MSGARDRLLAVPLGLLLSLLFAGTASAAVEFTVAPGPVNPGQAITVTPTLTAPQLLLTNSVLFRFNGNDADDRLDSTAPFDPVSFTYQTAGLKTITMEVDFTVDPDEVQQHKVRINALPEAAFDRNVTVPNVGQSVRFDAGASTDDQENEGSMGDGETTTPLANSAYEWDFDNNGSYEQVGQVVQRAFTTPGNKTVRLRVTDAGGRTDTVQAVVHVNFPPVASFLFTPRAPRVNEVIDFTSVSDDPDDPIALVEWDLDGDGQFDDGRGSTAARAFDTAGSHTVRLRVRDTRGRVASTLQTVSVTKLDPLPPPTKLRPWPKIRIVGFAGLRRVRVDLLTIRTIQGATVKIRCSGSGCPRKTAVSTRARKALVRVRWLERRLRTGTRLYVAVTKPGFIGRYERILLRRKKEPLRRMSCLYPGESTARKCP